MKNKAGLSFVLASIIGIAAVTGNAAEPIKVALFWGMDQETFEKSEALVPQRGIMEALEEMPDVRAECVNDMSRKTLDKFDILVVCQSGNREKYRPANWPEMVRDWVRDGHGLLVTHDAVGYRSYPVLFPKIAVGVGNPYEDRDPYSREWCIACDHPITRGLNSRDRFKISFYDTITLDPCEDGVVVARCVDMDFGRDAMSGAPAMVCGEPGKGRYVANGAYLAGLAPTGKVIKPLGGERKLLENCIRWLAKREDDSKTGQDIGRGINLGPKTACPVDPELPVIEQKGLKGISCESVLAGCEIPVEPRWKNMMKEPPAEMMKELSDGAPVPIDERFLDRPLYNPTPVAWPQVDLCGLWKLNRLPDTQENPEKDPGTVQGFWKKDYDDSSWGEFEVPGIWDGDRRGFELEPDPEYTKPYGVYEKNNFTGVGWYRRQFELPETFKDKRVLLNFGGVDQSCIVYVNGKKVGACDQNFSPFQFDITDAARVGETNILAVRVYDGKHSTYLDRHGVYHKVGGLYERVSVCGAPRVYAKRVLVTPHLADSTLEIDAVLCNTGKKEVSLPLEARVSPDPHQSKCVTGKSSAFTEKLGDRKLVPGDNELSFKVTMKNPVCWDTENPFLYILNLCSGEDVLSRERFGFREFKQEGRFLYLNGRRFYLMGYIMQPGTMCGIRAIEVFNKNDSLTRILLANKAMGMNCVIPYLGQGMGQTVYDVCDETGTLILDWTVIGFPSDGRGLAWLYPRYNHPSLGMLILFNEARDPNLVKLIDSAYVEAQKADKQDRPVCSAGGNAPSIAAVKADVADVHIYPGTIGGHALDMASLLRKFNEDVWKYYGVDIPVSNLEMGGASYARYLGSKNFAEYRRLLTEQPPGYKEDLVSALEAFEPGYHATLDLSWAGLYGMRRLLVQDYDRVAAEGLSMEGDNKEKREFQNRWDAIRQRRNLKQSFEGCRRIGDLFQGWGFNWYAGDSWKGAGSTAAGIIEGPICLSAPFNEYKRGNNLKYVCFDVYNQNVFTGGKWSAVIYAINDRPEDSNPWKVRVVVKDGEDKRVADFEADVGRVPSGKRKLAPIEWQIPKSLKGGWYRTEVLLVEGKEVVADNHDELFVMNGNILKATVPANGKKVALFVGNAQPVESASADTQSILDALKVPYDKIDDFDGLDKYQVLIIGAHGINRVFDTSGRRIADWLEKGGRLLQLEQFLPGRISYLPQLSIVKKYGGAVADIIVDKHPVYEGISDPGNWERWSGELPEAFEYGTVGGIFSALIAPVNRTMLAVGVMLIPRESNKAVQMLAAEVKVGKGVALLSQAEATRRYGVDCVATRYMQNLIEYILSDNMKYAETLPLFEVKNFDPHRCGYIDFTQTAKADCKLGKEQATEVEKGIERFSDLPFRVKSGKAVLIDKQTGVVEIPMSDSKLMFPEWEAEKRKTDTDQLGLATDKAEAYYFLVRADNVAPKQKIGRVFFIYRDGGQIEVPLEEGVNIGDSGSAPEMPNAGSLGEEIYVMRWVNPTPEKPLRAIRVDVSDDKAKVYLLGATGYLVRNKIHD